MEYLPLGDETGNDSLSQCQRIWVESNNTNGPLRERHSVTGSIWSPTPCAVTLDDSIRLISPMTDRP